MDRRPNQTDGAWHCPSFNGPDPAWVTVYLARIWCGLRAIVSVPETATVIGGMLVTGHDANRSDGTGDRDRVVAAAPASRSAPR
jgi:hypothetical protein